MKKKTTKKNIKKEEKATESNFKKTNVNEKSSKTKDTDEVDEVAEISKETELQNKIDELNDKYLRLYSEFDNYRKRTSKEKLELNKTASEGVILDLLPVIDDFERAIKSSEVTDECTAVKDGINLIYSKFNGILVKKGLSPVDALGKEFDTDFHEAITQIPAPSKDLKGKVVDVVEKGYLLHDKVIRYSKVVIGK